MKRLISLSMLVAFLTTIIFYQSCTYDKCQETRVYKIYTPVYMTKEQLKNIKIIEAVPLKNPGKIYVYGKYLFINEPYEGIHIFDNSDVANPVNLSFLSIPGNVDMAVKDDVLYADNYIDLLSFDLSNPEKPEFIKTIKDVFNKNRYYDKTRGYMVMYKPTDRIEELDCNDAIDDTVFRGNDVLVFEGSKSGSNSSSGSSNQNVGIGGSMARFTILNNRLYTIDNSKLQVFDIKNAKEPNLTNDISIGWGIETIYPVKDKLFIGSNSGMYVYSVSKPDNPTLLSTFRHASACDPVYVVGDIAYITLRSGTACQGYTNQLDVVDISDILAPRMIKSYPMDNPHGLTVLDDKLILCEGDFGAKVLNVEDPKKIKVKSKITDKHFYDVIGIDAEDIIIIGNDGLYQYELKGYDLNEIGVILIEK